MKLNPASHVDHVPAEVLAYVLDRFKGKDSFFIGAFDLPAHLPSLACSLYGPIMGDGEVTEEEVRYEKRPGRNCNSRLVDRPKRPVRQCTVIGGPFEGEPCVLYTVYGGPNAPKEPGDPSIKSKGERESSESFWRFHALSDHTS